MSRSFNTIELVKSLTGSVSPTGEHSYDMDVISPNLDELIELVDSLIEELIYVSSYARRPEESVRKLGEKAKGFLITLNEIEVEVEDD